jgi:serine protease Do
MSDALERVAGEAAPVTLETIARQQRYVILSLMVVSLMLGVLIGAVITRGALADPDNRIVISSQGAVTDALSAAFANAADVVEPAVVHIDVREGDERLGREAKGSGVLVTSSGYILTNNHVIEGATKIRVRLYDHREFDAKVIGSDLDTDLAVLKISAGTDLPYARFGDSSKLRVGDWVLAVGSPFGLEQTVTAGIISAKDRETDGGASAFQAFLQTDAAINPGNSGGPLVNLTGEVVGINTQIATRTGAFSGIGFALPSSTATEIYNQLVATGRVNRGFLGVKVGDVTQALADKNRLDSTDGVLLEGIEPAGPAEAAGLRKGDVVLEINGERVKDRRDLIRRVGSYPAGTVVRVTYVRDGAAATATVKLTDRGEGLEASTRRLQPEDGGGFDDDEPLPPGHPDVQPQGSSGLGISSRTLTPDLARERALEGLRGAYVTYVEPGSPAAAKGLKTEDVIFSANQRRIAGPPELDELLAGLDSGDQVTLGIARRSGAKIERLFITVTVP